MPFTLLNIHLHLLQAIFKSIQCLPLAVFTKYVHALRLVLNKRLNSYVFTVQNYFLLKRSLTQSGKVALLLNLGDLI